MPDDKLPEIDPAQLQAVTGGAGADEQVTAMLQSVLSSIKDLAETRNSGGGAFDQMMPMMMMMMMNRGSAAPVAAAPAATCPCAGAGAAGGDGWIKVT